MADNFNEMEELEKSLDIVRRDLERLNGDSGFRNLDKSRVGKHISKKFVNGKWVYKYYQDRNTARVNIKPCAIPLLNCNIKNALQEGERFIKDWQKDWELHPYKSHCHALNGKTVVIAAIDDKGNEGISLKHFGYKGSQKNKMRPATQILERAQLLPVAKEMLESKDKCVLNEVRSDSDFIDYELLGKTITNGKTKKVCVIVSKKRNDKLTYLSIMEKALSEGKAFLKDVHFWAEQAANPKDRSATTNKLPQNNLLVNKSISIIIDDITEGNRAKKYKQLEKALTGKTYVKVPADDTEKLPLLNIRIKDYSLGKVNKALRAASLSLGVPTKSAKGEAFTFKAQEELTDKWAKFFSNLVNNTYNFVIDYFDLPKITVMSKAVNLTWKGKVLYSPESGEPISQKEWDFFVKNLEKFLNRNISNAAEKIVLDSKALGHILDRMLKTNTLEAVKKQRLDDLKLGGKSFDWIADSVKNMKNAFGESLTRPEQARITVIQQSAAEKITRISDSMKSEVRQILIDGVVDHKSKSQVSQALFDRMVNYNRDFQRIADTEIQKTFNNSFIREEVHNAEEDEKVYFERVEVIDGNTCPYCEKINGKIAVWSDTPLADGAVKDEYADLAIWEGKEWNGKKLERIADAPISICHPWCYSDDTEVMTNNGFKLFKDVKDNDLIMAINPNTKEIDFVPFVKRVEYDYNGKMIKFPGTNFDLLVTPDHNMLEITTSGKMHGIPAEELIKKENFSLPRAVGMWKKEDTERYITFAGLKVSKTQYFRLWGWYLSEGSGRHKVNSNCYEIKLAQKDPMKILKDLSDFASVLSIGKEAIYICGEVAKSFSFMFENHAEQKYIPDFIKNSSVENIKEFLEAFLEGDGTNKMFKASPHAKAFVGKEETLKRTIRTSSPKMADDLCELIIKIGKMPSVYVVHEKGKEKHFRNGDYILNTDCYNISICDSKTRTYAPDREGYLPRKHPYYQDYNGKVYDVELEKWHFLLVRRNGKCAWSGNCRGTWIRCYPELDGVKRKF